MTSAPVIHAASGGMNALLTTKQAAEYLGLGVSTLERHRCFGTGPRFLKLSNGKTVRYRREDLEAWCVPLHSTSEDASKSAGPKSRPGPAEGGRP